MQIKSVVIIGSGTMGSGIAAHLCNANVPVTLLDLSTDISTKARERIYKSRPPLLIDKNKIDNIKVLEDTIAPDFLFLKILSYILCFISILSTTASTIQSASLTTSKSSLMLPTLMLSIFFLSIKSGGLDLSLIHI